MDKKDIYEHLAHIYLDASSKRKNKSKENKGFKNLFPLATFFILGVTVVLIVLQNKTSPANYKHKLTSELAIILQNDVVKINFNFNPIKKEVYSINLNNLNLKQFKAIGFSIRKANFDDKIILKVEFTNAAKETAEIYLSNFKAYKWEDYKIPLSFFKNIANWSQMGALAFIIEEGTTRQDHGIVYIDNIRLLR